ncbi:MAG: endonuclease/exonuclease/phosphatase family protein [Arenicellales bacterium]
MLLTSLLLIVSACTQIKPPLLLGPGITVSNTIKSETLTLLTLNLAHGRKDSFNQLLVPASTFLANLDDVADLLTKANADVVALQEADGPSRWSGQFDHVGYLANVTGYPANVRSDHVKGNMINYGTGLLSRVPFKEVLSHDFPKSPPTLRKGFTLGQIDWQPDEDKPPVAIDILSVHLDFSRSKVRQQQISDILRVLDNRDHPTIILGDFNSDWLKTDSVIRTLAECGNTKAFEPHSINHGTYKFGKRRLDWVLLSAELEFKRYEVLPDIVSDHQAIVVEVAHAEGSPRVVDSENSTSENCNSFD